MNYLFELYFVRMEKFIQFRTVQKTNKTLDVTAAAGAVSIRADQSFIAIKYT